MGQQSGRGHRVPWGGAICTVGDRRGAGGLADLGCMSLGLGTR
jgi:hypothetical protein